jgi:hypothetical protein
MAQFSRFNAIDQLLDVAGSERQANDRLLTDETGGLGSPVILNSGTAATITAFATPNLTVGGLTGQSASSVGTLISLRGAAIAGNNGVFRVNSNTSGTVDVLTDSNGYFPDPNSGSLIWEQYNAGIGASITTVVSGIVTITGVANMSADSVGHFITISGAASAGNNGTFLITAFNSATSVSYANSAGVASDANNPNIVWTERLPYSLNDDIDFERSDRTYIKGVNFDQPMPTYTRPTLAGIAVPASIANIAGKTLDAFARNINRGQFNWPVEVTLTDIYGAGTLKHADAVDNTGVPVYDAAPFTNDWNSCFVEVTNAVDGTNLEVQTGLHAGERIFGVTYNGSSTSPNSVEIHWYSCPNGGNISTGSTAYSWEKGAATGTNAGTGATLTVTTGANGASAITGFVGTTFSSTDVGNWETFSGFTNAGNNGTFVIISVQSATAITVQNHAAVSETSAAAAVSYTEYAKSVPTFVNLTYAFNERLDQLDQNAFRFPLATGLVSDADLRQDIIDLQSTGGWADGTTNLSTYLTNTGANYVFFTLPGGAGDTVVAALNALNQQIGNRTYTGPYLTNGQSITASLQALSNAVSSASVVRYIDRLAAANPANTAITLPGGASYTIDGTNNGKYLWVFWRGILRDPGTVANGDDYAETSTTSITPYSKLNAGDHISFFVL